jgi:hypothetical protein
MTAVLRTLSAQKNHKKTESGHILLFAQAGRPEMGRIPSFSAIPEPDVGGSGAPGVINARDGEKWGANR